MANIIKNVFQNRLIYKGYSVLRYRIEFPQIKGKNKFNIYNYVKAKTLQKECEEQLFEEAKKLFEYNQKNGYPHMEYEIISSYIVTTNYEEIVSLYNDEYRFTGGAHGTTVRTSQTWNVNKDEMMELKDFYKNDPNYVSKIISNVNNQIKTNIENENNYYFDNYCCLTVENFKVENFYLDGNKVVVYYQQYDIGPYSSGILTFTVPNS